MRNLSALKTFFRKPFGKQMSVAGALLLLTALAGPNVFAQGQVSVNSLDHPGLQRYENARISGDEILMQASRPATPSTQVIPLGTRSSGAVTTVKIGEASNAFSTLSEEVHPVSVLNGYGTNNEGIITFVQRQNLVTCGGSAPFENGRARYVISTDGGATWDVGGGVTVSTAANAPQNHCFGITQLNPTYLQRGRFPMAALFDVGGNGMTNDVALVYVGASRGDDNPRVWDGSTNSFLTGAASGNPSLDSEEYLFSQEINSIPYSLVERIPGEYWYVSDDRVIANNQVTSITISAFKGVYNSTDNKIDWSVAYQVTPNFNTGFDGGIRVISPLISFSPDGMDGTIGFLGDLVGGEDTVYSPCFIQTTDGGATWGAPYEFNMADFPQLAADHRSNIVEGTDTNGNIVDTLLPTGKATTAFSADLVVDANGNPHMFAVVGAASSTSTQGLFTTSPDASYSITGLIYDVYDFTKDSFGDWNMLHVADMHTLRGYHGDFAVQGDALTIDPHMQIARSNDGTKIFYITTDTDTTGGNGPIASPVGVTGANNNHSPDMKVRSFDINSYQMSALDIPTANDPLWAGRILLPKLSHVTRDVGSDHQLPVVFADLTAGSSLSTTSYYYITDVTINDSAYTETADFWYNCKQDPYANSLNTVNPGCGASDGELSITVSGGNAPYNIAWNTGSTNDTITGLPGGIYAVTVTDSLECKESTTINLNTVNAPQIATSGVADITCNGANDGTATVAVTGGAGNETYTWSNGELTAMATTLPPGTSTVQVTDANGCSAFETVTIAEPVSISLSAAGTDIDCFGAANGTATAMATGGTGTIGYSWDNGDMGASISALAAGSYIVTVTDANNCTTNETVLISEPAQITATLTATPNIGPISSPTGFASVTVGGGTIPYTYSWYDGAGYTNTGGNFINGVCEGWYYVEITDNNNCTYLDSVEVPVPVGTLGCGTGIEEELAAGITTMQLLPNPNNGSFKLRLELDRPEDLRIEVISMTGKVVARELASKVLVHEQAFQLNGLASGIYLVQVTTARGTAAQKVIVQ